MRAAGLERALALSFLGDKTWAGVALVREAARVVRVLAAGLVAAGALGATVLVLFLGTASSAAFSLSSLEISSLPRFFVRVDLVSLATLGLIVGFVTGGFGAGLDSS